MLLPVIILAQSKSRDSLNSALEKSKNDSNKVNILNKLSRDYYLSSEYDRAKADALEAKKISEKLNFKRGAILANKNLGNIYLDQNDYPKALNFQLTALQLAKEVHDIWTTALLFTNIGNIYNSMTDYKNALEYYLESKKTFETIQKTNTIQYVNTLYNTAVCYYNQKQFDPALALYLKSFDLYTELGDEGGISISLIGIGNVYMDSKKELSIALDYYLKSLDILKKLNDISNLALVYYDIGMIYHNQDNNLKAIEFCEKSLDLAKKNGLLSQLANAQSQLDLIYYDKHDYKNAYSHYKKYIQLRDSMMNEESMKQVSDMEFKVKEKEIQFRNEQEKLKAEAELRHQKLIRNAFTAGFALVLMLAFVILYSLRETRIKNKIIEIQKAEVEAQHRLIEHKQKEIVDSITYARRIQHALLASESLLNENLSNYFIYFQPKDIVSGDFYWASDHNGLFYLIAADSTGHGVPGAFMSLLNISFLNDAITEKQLREPHMILNQVREGLIRSLKDDGSEEGGKDGMDCVLCAFDFQNMRLDYAAANNSFYVIREAELIVCKADKMPVGKSPRDEVSFSPNSFELKKGDVVYIFTDGLPDQFGGPTGKKLKYKPFEEKLLAICQLPMEQQRAEIDTLFRTWKGDYEQVDDVLVIGVAV